MAVVDMNIRCLKQLPGPSARLVISCTCDAIQYCSTASLRCSSAYNSAVEAPLSNQKMMNYGRKWGESGSLYAGHPGPTGSNLRFWCKEAHEPLIMPL